MNTKITIGCRQQSSQVQFLKEEFNIVEPYVLSKNGEVIKNFDVFLNFDSVIEDSVLMTMHKIPQIGFAMSGKYMQFLVAKMCKVPTPRTYKIPMDITQGKRMDSLYLLLRDVDDIQRLILKAEFGAKGLGQALVSKKGLWELIEDCWDESFTAEMIDNKYETGGQKTLPIQKQRIVDVIKSGEFIIQEKVNLDKEWRYVYFYNHAPMIVERKPDPEKWQLGTSTSGEGKVVTYDAGNPHHLKMQQYAWKIAKKMNTPFLSLDFYYDEESKELGLFEFQMQFGYHIMPKDEVVGKVISSTRDYLEEVIKL